MKFVVLLLGCLAVISGVVANLWLLLMIGMQFHLI